AAFGNQDLFPRRLEGRGADARRRERFPRIRELTPALLIVGVPDPDVEIRVDPGAGKDPAQLQPWLRAGLGHGHGAELRVPRQPTIQGAQERPASALEVLPGVLAVENDWDHRFAAAGALAVASAPFDQAADEIVRRGVSV